MVEQKKKQMMRKGIFFKLGSEQCCHHLGSEKMAFSLKMVGIQHKPDIGVKIQTFDHC